MRRVRAAILLLFLVLGPAASRAADAATPPTAATCVGLALTDVLDAACGMRLAAGPNAFVWPNASTPIDAAFAGDRLAFLGKPPASGARPVDTITVWQQDGNVWRGWSAAGTTSAAPLPTLEPGSTYILVANGDLAWSTAPQRAASVFAQSRIVAFYGRPGVPQMGILGQYATANGAAKAVAAEAAKYAALDKTRRVVPALHLIVDAAQADAGNDGTYLGRLPLDVIQPYVDATRDAGELLFLDLQIGWGEPRTEVRRLASVLREPHVHLALDPEFATAGKNEAPGEAIGYLTADQLNAVQGDLAAIARDAGVPPKILVVHQFRFDMLRQTPDIQRVPGVDLVIDMDGWGPPGQKLDGYAAFARAPYAAYAGFKLFYLWDSPVLTPVQVMALSHPPDLIIYQ